MIPVAKLLIESHQTGTAPKPVAMGVFVNQELVAVVDPEHVASIASRYFTMLAQYKESLVAKPPEPVVPEKPARKRRGKGKPKTGGVTASSNGEDHTLPVPENSSSPQPEPVAEPAETQ